MLHLHGPMCGRRGLQSVAESLGGAVSKHYISHSKLVSKAQVHHLQNVDQSKSLSLTRLQFALMENKHNNKYTVHVMISGDAR